MIPNKENSATVVSTMTGKRGKFSVHEHAHEKIMGVLTNLYEDPEGAVVREYLTNALDSQIEAKEKDPDYVWRPIEVTTPSHFNKTYIIRDFGIGMTVDDIEKVYSQYGYSTKEHTNDQTGMLGLGSKCGLTYTGQFTITGYRNGVRVRALITLNEDEVPEYIILDTSATDEPNGVEISVPVRDRNTFEEKTKKFLKWWKPGQVLVNGHEWAGHDHPEVKPGVFLLNHNRWEAAESVVIMGNVPYTVDQTFVPQVLRDASLGFAAEVEMGAVDFPPNRERLRYNSRTKKAIEDISNGLFEAVLAEKLKEIENAPTHQEAYQLWISLDHHFSSTAQAKALTYKGSKFQRDISHDNMWLDWDYQGHGQISNRKTVRLDNFMSQGTLIVTGVTQGTKPTSYFKKKVRHYIRENSFAFDQALLVDEDIDNAWVAHMPRVSADTIRAIKLPKDGTTTGPREVAMYDSLQLDSNGGIVRNSEPVITVPAGKTLVYVYPQDIRDTYRHNGITESVLMKAIGDDYVLIALGKNREAKFLRLHPQAKSLRVAMTERINLAAKSITDAEYLVDKLSYSERDFLNVVDYTKVDDPDVVEVAKVVQATAGTGNTLKGLNKLVETLYRASMRLEIPVTSKKVKNPMKKYPLVDYCGNRHQDHMIVYMNAVYAASNKK